MVDWRKFLNMELNTFKNYLTSFFAGIFSALVIVFSTVPKVELNNTSIPIWLFIMFFVGYIILTYADNKLNEETKDADRRYLLGKRLSKPRKK